MKKLISIFLIIFTVASLSIASFAEIPEIDFASLSDEELLALKSDLESELNARNNNGIVPPEGIIKCPEGIDPGSYKITPIGDDKDAAFGVQGSNGKMIMQGDAEIGHTYQLSIEEGQNLLLQGKFLLSKPDKISF